MKTMGVVKMKGDGDCCFHALAYFNAHDGKALRIEVADFMEEHALDQPGFEEEWLLEASKLRANRWGGHSAIAAYSLLKGRRVIVHTRNIAAGTVDVQEQSHGFIYGSQQMEQVHILYNGIDHYDALVEMDDAEGLEPAWPQPPPPVYCILADDRARAFPPLGSNAFCQGAVQAGRRRFTAPRPTKKAKAKAKTAAVKQPEKVAQEPLPAAPSQADAQGEEEENVPGLMEELEAIPVTATSQHPHRKVEDLIEEGRGRRDQGTGFCFNDKS